MQKKNQNNNNIKKNKKTINNKINIKSNNKIDNCNHLNHHQDCIEVINHTEFAIIKFNFSHNLNALSQHFIKLLNEKINVLDTINKCKIIIFTGVEKAFSAGVDIKEMQNVDGEKAYNMDYLNPMWDAIYNLKIPTIAAVNGYALGGGFELALMCDIIFASKNAKFSFPEVNLGLMPGLGGIHFLNQIIGKYKTADLVMSGKMIDAQKAYELGIVTDVVENDALEHAINYAKQICKKPYLAVKAIKEAVKYSNNIGIDQARRNDRDLFYSLFSTKDKIELIEKFLKK